MLVMGAFVVIMVMAMAFSYIFYQQAGIAKKVSAQAFARDMARIIDQASGTGGGFRTAYSPPAGMDYVISVGDNIVEVSYESGEAGSHNYAGAMVAEASISSEGVSSIIISRDEATGYVRVEGV